MTTSSHSTEGGGVGTHGSTTSSGAGARKTELVVACLKRWRAKAANSTAQHCHRGQRFFPSFQGLLWASICPPVIVIYMSSVPPQGTLLVRGVGSLLAGHHRTLCVEVLR